MSLSPNECKWSKRLTLTQRGMRSGFTVSPICMYGCVCVCVVRWRKLHQYIYCSSCREECWSMHLHFTPALCQPHFPWNFDLRCLWSIPQEDRLTLERRGVCLGMFGSCFLNKLNCIFVVSPQKWGCSIWIPADQKKKHMWVRSCAAPVTSPLTFIEHDGTLFNCQYNRVYSERSCSSSLHQLASWTPTNAGLHSRLFKWSCVLAKANWLTETQRGQVGIAKLLHWFISSLKHMFTGDKHDQFVNYIWGHPCPFVPWWYSWVPMCQLSSHSISRLQDH